MARKQSSDWSWPWFSTFSDSERRTEELWRISPVYVGSERFDAEFEITSYMKIRWGIEPKWDGKRYHVRGSRDVINILSTFFYDIGLESLEYVNSFRSNHPLLGALFNRYIDEWIQNQKYDYEIREIDPYLQEIIFKKFFVMQRKVENIYEVKVRR